MEAIVSAVETDVYDKFDAEVETQYVGELVMQHLRNLDQVAYVRFASVYREFEDVRDFVDELEPILAESRRKPRSALRPAIRAARRAGRLKCSARDHGGCRCRRILRGDYLGLGLADFRAVAHGPDFDFPSGGFLRHRQRNLGLALAVSRERSDP